MRLALAVVFDAATGAFETYTEARAEALVARLFAAPAVVGFNVRPAGQAGALAQKEGIEIRLHRIIYDVTDDIRSSMEGLLAPTLIERPIGKARQRRS
jgi:translation initiation factor IF-2